MAETRNFADVFAEDLADESDDSASSQLDPSTVFTDDEDGLVGGHVDHGDHAARFDGDTSALPPHVCWTLQELVASPHVTEKSKRHWPVVLQYEDVLRSRLSELGLVLEINREYRYAFTRQAVDPSPHSRTILRAKTLSLAASALLLYLYNQYVVAPDDCIVERSDMVEHMLAYKPTQDTDEVAFRKKVDTAIKSLEDVSVIKPIRGHDDRFIVYGVITAILTADQVTALDVRYRAIGRGDREAAAHDEQEQTG